MKEEKAKRMKRNREARLQRQAEVVDEFDQLCAIATGGESTRPASGSQRLTFGGSLPSFHLENNSPSPVDPPEDNNPANLIGDFRDKLRLHVPAAPMMMQRCHSDGECGSLNHLGVGSELSSGATTPRSPARASPNKFFNNVKNLLESCESSCSKGSCVSPPSSPPMLGIPKCPTAPHSRSSSLKKKKKKQLIRQEEMKDRTSSMPSINKRLSTQRRPCQLPLSPMHLQPSTDDDWERVRNFMTSPKGIINCGDSFRRSNSSLRSLGSWGSGSHGSEDLGLLGCGSSFGRTDTQESVPSHKVVILGGPGVGKTTLAQQFVTSECLVNVESVGEFEDCITVTVLLNDEEARLDILEVPYNNDYKQSLGIDAYVIVFATNDRSSFHHAVDLLYSLRKEDCVDRPVILVANKTDLVRAREIAEQEGKSVAVTYNCKYFEVSSLMNLEVDKLLAGLLNQIRLHNLRGSKQALTRPPEPPPKSPMAIVGKIFSRPRGLLRRQGSKSCDNLLVM